MWEISLWIDSNSWLQCQDTWSNQSAFRSPPYIFMRTDATKPTVIQELSQWRKLFLLVCFVTVCSHTHANTNTRTHTAHTTRTHQISNASKPDLHMCVLGFHEWDHFRVRVTTCGALAFELTCFLSREVYRHRPIDYCLPYAVGIRYKESCFWRDSE